MSIKNFFKNIFNAKAKEDTKEHLGAINDGFVFSVTPAEIEDTTLSHREERAAAQAGTQIMAVAVNIGVNGGYMVYGDYGVSGGLTYQEDDFKIAVKPSGAVYLACDASFAEVVKTLPAVKDVKHIGVAPSPRPKI